MAAVLRALRISPLQRRAPLGQYLIGLLRCQPLLARAAHLAATCATGKFSAGNIRKATYKQGTRLYQTSQAKASCFSNDELLPYIQNGSLGRAIQCAVHGGVAH